MDSQHANTASCNSLEQNIQHLLPIWQQLQVKRGSIQSLSTILVGLSHDILQLIQLQQLLGTISIICVGLSSNAWGLEALSRP